MTRWQHYLSQKGRDTQVNAQGQPQAYELRRIASLAWLASPEQAAEKAVLSGREQRGFVGSSKHTKADMID
eukprot:3901548-Amphidinium_carterae.1